MIDQILGHRSESIAVIDECEPRPCSYDELRVLVDACRRSLAGLPQPALVLHACPNCLGGIASYLGALSARVPLILADPVTSAMDTLIRVYAPTAIVLSQSQAIPVGYRLLCRTAGERIQLCLNENERSLDVKPHPELALLLTTSGSTGNPKIVRLSRNNLQANARSISDYLQLGLDEVAILSLPMHYSYGLSVVNSHLLAGATVVVTNQSFIRREFWDLFDRSYCTSFAGVPYMYETLHRLRIMPSSHATLRSMTQAGGHLRPELVKSFNDAAQATGKRLFVMYGQTEATARIAYVPPQRLADKLGSIGIAIPDGRLTLDPLGEGGHSELVYDGPNVMLGYAERLTDLALGDSQGGHLRTGDLAECDSDGFFRITGRLARFAKLFGKRVQLGDVEAHLEARLGLSVAAIEGVDYLDIFLEGGGADEQATGKAELTALLGIPPAAIKMHAMAALPKTQSGKKDYRALRK